MERRIVEELYELIIDRKMNPREGSYTCGLFRAGKDEIIRKIGEESVEVIIASKGRSKEQVVSEIADLLYHILVLLAASDIPVDAVYEELTRRRDQKRQGKTP